MRKCGDQPQGQLFVVPAYRQDQNSKWKLDTLPTVMPSNSVLYKIINDLLMTRRQRVIA